MAEYPLNSGYLDDSLKLKRLIRTLRKRWLVVLATSVTVFAGTAYYTFTRTPLYQSSASLLIDNTTIPVAADLPSVNPTSSGIMVRDANLSTEIAILKSRPLIESAIAKLKTKTGKPIDNLFVQTVVDNLTIRPEKDAMVLRLTYRDSNPQRARDILESLSDTYAEYSLKDRRTKSSNAIKFIEAKLPEVRKQLEKSALAMTQFRKTYNIVDPESYAASVYKMRENLEQQAQDLQIKIAQTQRQYEEIQRQVGKPTDVALSSAMLAQDSTYQSLVKQYQEAVTNYSLERTRFSENTPSVQGLKDRRDQLYRLMQAQAQTLLGNKAPVTGLSTEIPAQAGGSSIQQNLATQLFDAQTAIAVQQAQVNSIRSAQSQISTVFAQIPQLQQKYTELQRQLALDTSIFTKLSEKLEELRIAEAQEISSWRELEPPFLPTSPISPDINRNLLLGGLAGIVFGIALAYLLERSDQRIREVDEVKELIDIPLLGAIPRTDITSLNAAPGKARVLPSYSHSAFREALSSFALNLRYLGSDQSIKTIAFTSAVPSEGKSTLIFNLSTILAEFGNSVLLIDADMRKPMIHRLANTHNRYGLSTAIATNRPWRQLVQAGDTKGLLHILTSGPIPPNPIVLLESNKMSALLEVWRESYDYVLIDTPPVVGVSDAQSLASRVDTVVLVAAIERSTRPAIARALEILASSRGNVAGILINLINKTDSSYHYGYYSSYYYQYPSQLPEGESVIAEEDDDEDLELIEDEDDLARVKTEA
ncbi:polysaccharide biosynthesis tyrosine autokinase [Tumidithrix helvetica PCC 7403]|uniref:GumC family protein n=1 Tax=Tumidithrix helvetica TaxID=3457545 RepID=UPI003CB2F0B4